MSYLTRRVYECAPNSSKQRAIALLLERLDGLFWERGAGLLERVVAGLEVDEGELEVQRRGERFEDASAGLC